MTKEVGAATIRPTNAAKKINLIDVLVSREFLFEI